VRVPDEASNGKAKVSISFPDWKDVRVLPAVFEIPVLNTEPADKK